MKTGVSYGARGGCTYVKVDALHRSVVLDSDTGDIHSACAGALAVVVRRGRPFGCELDLAYLVQAEGGCSSAADGGDDERPRYGP